MRERIAPSGSTAAVVAGVFVTECAYDQSLVSIPRPEPQVVVRFGPSAFNGLDIHVFGARQTVRRKRIRAGQRSVTVRLRLGAAEAVLGVPASAIADRIVALDDLWGEAATRPLLDRLAGARTTLEAAAIVDGAIADRVAGYRAGSSLALEAVGRLEAANVNAVAVDLGVSERHLRRVFRDAFGVSPKAFARLARFHRALQAARSNRAASWASIAVAAGYYDQAHLIDDFRAIAGVTPRVLVGELEA